MADDTKNIVVVGAGVIGLTTALMLSKKNPAYKITIVAKHMPGDYDIEYASPWAGANYLPVLLAGTEGATWEANTWPELKRLAEEVPEAGLHFQDMQILRRNKDSEGTIGKWQRESRADHPWFENLFENYRTLSGPEIRPGYDDGVGMKSICLNVAIYLPWLLGQCLARNIVVKRAILTHISEASKLSHTNQPASVIMNCTGLSSYHLGGVTDKTLTPARGQICIVRNSPGAMYVTSGTDEADDELMYIMERAHGGGTVLGGCYQKGNWESQPDLNMANRIMKRCVEFCPELTGGVADVSKLDIIRHAVGLRPVREGGTRIEKEKIGDTWVVHNYGHGGFGYQSSYGCGEVAVKLVEEVLKG